MIVQIFFYYEANECVLMTYAFLHNLFLFFLGLIIASNFHLFSFLSTPKSSHVFPQLCKALLNHISALASLGDSPLTSGPRPHDPRCPSWNPLIPLTRNPSVSQSAVLLLQPFPLLTALRISSRFFLSPNSCLPPRSLCSNLSRACSQ